MPDARRHSPRRRLQATVMRAVNVVMRVILGLPGSTPLGNRLMLAYVVGRRSGRIYRQPVGYVRDGGTLLTPGGRWKLNLRPGVAVRLRIKGHDVKVRPELIDDLVEVDRLLGVIYAANPAATSFVGVARGTDGRLDRDQLRTAIAYGFRVARWRLVDVADVV